jgi:hypothetical protein
MQHTPATTTVTVPTAAFSGQPVDDRGDGPLTRLPANASATTPDADDPCGGLTNTRRQPRCRPCSRICA